MSPVARYVAAALVFAGWMMSALGLIELQKAWHSQTAPVAMTCAELASHGPHRSLYVTLTDYIPDEDGIVLEDDKQGEWTQANVPLLDEDLNPAKVIARVYRHRQPVDESPADTFSKPLTGMVQRFGNWPEGRALLNELNPDMDAANCWVLNIGSTPYIAWQLQAIVLGGIALFAVGVLILATTENPTGDVARAMIPLIALIDGLRWLGSKLGVSTELRGSLLAVLAAALLMFGSYEIMYARELSPVHALLRDNFWSALGSVLAMNLGAGFVLLSIYWMFTDRREDAYA